MRHILIMKEVILVVMCMLLAGCMGPSETKTETFDDEVMVDEQWNNESVQYWNVNPMSRGNNTIIMFNETGDVNMTLNLSAFFHEPLLWEQGFVNYSIIYNNETVWAVEENEGLNEYSFNISNVSGNLTIRIQSSGSDSQTDDKPGDFFIAQTYIQMWNEE